MLLALTVLALASPPRLPPLPVSRGPDVLAGFEGGLDIASTPGPNGIVGLGFGIGIPRFRFKVAGAWVPPRRATTDAGSIRVMLGLAAVRGCVRLGSNPLESPICLGVEVGGMRGFGERLDARTGLWIAPTLSGGGTYWIRPRIGLRARLELAVPATRPRFVLAGPDGPVSLFASPPVTGRVLVGLEFRLNRLYRP